MKSFSVSSLSEVIKSLVEDNLYDIQVTGEVFTMQRAHSGHVYLTLREGDDSIDAVCWRGNKDAHAIKEGEVMVFTGRVVTYNRRSKYQIEIKTAAIKGQGEILQQIEVLRKKLEAEGLFDPARKKSLPVYPALVGIVTSKTGSVIEDMRVCLERAAVSKILLAPASVQGESAVGELCDAIDKLVRVGAEVIIIARGGGSLEELMAFNNELLVRKIAECPVPIISGVGHEPDVTLVDYAADVRASTPTAAAMRVLPAKETELQSVCELQKHALRAVRDKLGQAMQINLRYVNSVCDSHKQSIDHLQQLAWRFLRPPILPTIPKSILAYKPEIANANTIDRRLTAFLDFVESVVRVGSPQEILKKGFCLARGNIGCKKSARDCAPGERVSLVFWDGVADALIKENS